MVSISNPKTISDTIFAAGLTRKAPKPLSMADRLIKSPRATSGPVRMQKLTGWSIVSGISMMRSPKQQSWQK